MGSYWHNQWVWEAEWRLLDPSSTSGSASIPAVLVGESELSPVPQFPHLKIKDKQHIGKVVI